MNRTEDPEDLAWRLRAACRGRDPALWFPLSPGAREVRIAKAFCSSCPVRPRCLHEALRRGDLQGIWGGLTTEERRRIGRRMQR